MSNIVDSNVTVSDVRQALNEIEADAIADSTIQNAIDDREIAVGTDLPAGWEDDPEITVRHVDNIVKHEAKRQAFNSAPTEVRVQALDAAVSLDIQAFRGQLRRDIERAWAAIGQDRGGSSSPFIDATGHAPGGGTRRRDKRSGNYNG